MLMVCTMQLVLSKYPRLLQSTRKLIIDKSHKEGNYYYYYYLQEACL